MAGSALPSTKIHAIMIPMDFRIDSKMKINSNHFRVHEGKKVNLHKWTTHVKPVYSSKEHYHTLLGEHVKQLSALQNLLYASNQHAVLLIFQAMDAAGKDGAIRHVMSGVNPQGCQVFSFKQPSSEELDHDFLWRTTRCLPERGRIGIFNRSYYEDVLVVKVHPELLQSLPDGKRGKSFWEERYEDINAFEVSTLNPMVKAISNRHDLRILSN